MEVERKERGRGIERLCSVRQRRKPPGLSYGCQSEDREMSALTSHHHLHLFALLAAAVVRLGMGEKNGFVSLEKKRPPHWI